MWHIPARDSSSLARFVFVFVFVVVFAKYMAKDVSSMARLKKLIT